MNKKVKRAIKLYPFYWGCGADLLFYVAVDTLFFVTVKHFSESQIVLLTSISPIVGMLLRFPVLWIAKKIGNTASIRIGTFCLLLSSVLITVGPNFAIVVVGRILREITYLTNDVAVVVALENNLEQVDESKDFIKYRTRGSMYYSAVTMVIALIATFLFNIHSYLPMICCICCAMVAFVLSFFIADYSPNNKGVVTEKKKKEKFNIQTFAIIAILAYGIGFTTTSGAIANAKLFIQQDIITDVGLKMTTTIVGGIYFLSRCARLLSNMVFVPVYGKLRLKTGLCIAGALTGAFSCMILGAFIEVFSIKILMMGLGYLLMLFCCDPIRHFVQQIIVQYAPREQHQDLFAYMGFVYNICKGACGMLFGLVLLRFTMVSVMVLYLLMAVVCVWLMYIIYRKVRC